MTDPKIRVSADVSGIESELKKVQAAAEKINRTLNSGQVGIDAKEAKRDLSDLEASSRNLTRLLDRVKQSGEGLAGVDLGRVSDALEEAAGAAETLDKVLDAVGQSSGMSRTVRAARDTADHINRAARAHKALSDEGRRFARDQVEGAKGAYDRWRSSGVAGTTRLRNMEFDDLVGGGWRGLSLRERDARRRYGEILEASGLHGASGETQAARRAIRGQRMSAAAGALGGLAGAMTGGGDGGMWSNSGAAGGAGIGLGAGMLFGGPVGAIVGAFAGRMLGGLGSSIDSGISRAGDEGADLSDLRQAIGATRFDFDDLRSSVRYFSEGLGMAYNESAKLAKQFAHVSGDGADLGRQVGSAAGFGRSYGIDPSAAVQFMAVMRHYGQSDGDKGNRKLALQIAEATQRGGTTGKMDEVLAAVQSFVQNSTRASLTSADPAAFASMMSAMTGLSLYGVKGDPGAAGAMMNAADAAMRQGGAFGEASKNFSLGLWQRNLSGFSAFDMDYMNEQGAFGSIGKAFGRNSAAYGLAKFRGDVAKMAQYDQWAAQGGDRSIMAMQMQALEQQFGGNTDEFRKSIQSHFGVGAAQASALYMAYKNDRGLGGLERSLSDAGVNVSSMNTKQIASLAELVNADKGGVDAQRKKLLGMKLGAGDKSVLEGAKTDDEIRKAVIQLSAKYDTAMDEGSRQRQVQADMNNAVQELATKLIPATLAIKDGMVEVVRFVSKAFGGSDWVAKMDADAKAERERISAEAAAIGQQKERELAEKNHKPLSTEELQARSVSLASLIRSRDAAASRGESTGVWDRNIAALDAEIKANTPAAGGGKGPRNLRNNNPGNIVYGDFARRMGATGSDGRFAIFPDKATGSAAMDSLLQSYGKKDGLDTVAGILGKWAPSSENDTNAYAATVAKRLGVGVNDKLNMSDPKVRAALGREIARYEGSADAYDSRVPSGTSLSSGGGGGAQLSGTVSGEIVVVDQNRQRTGQTVNVSGRFGAPVPAGMSA